MTSLLSQEVAEAVVAGLSIDEHLVGYNRYSKHTGVSDLSGGQCSQPSGPSVFRGG